MAAFVVSPVPMSVGGSVLDYLRYFRDIIVCNQWTDAQAAAIFKPLLGVGSHVLDDVPEADLTSFDKIDKVLSRKEAPFREASCSDLMSIYMRVGETVEEFRCRLTDLVEKCYGGFAQRNRQQLIRDFFVHRLADDLKSAILCTQSTKLDDAVNSALMAESMRGKFNFNNRAKAGHFKRNCPQLNVRVSRTDSIRQNKTVTCFYCKKAGHVKSNCPKLIVGVSRTATLEGDISSRFLLPVQLEHGCVQDFLVDSGGQSSCLPHAHFVSDGDYGRKLRFRSVNGTEIKVTGSKTLNLIMDGQRFTHKFPIVNMEGSPILGVDLLKKMRATICFKDGLIKLGNGSTFTLKPENIVKDCFAKASNIVDSRECDEKLDVNGETSDWFIEMAKVDNCYIAQKEDLAPEIEEESSWMVSKNIELAGKHVTEDLEALCNKYEEIFKQPKFSQSVGEHTIVTTAAPISQRPYKIPRVYEQQVTQKIDQMLNDGIIQESTTPRALHQCVIARLVAWGELVIRFSSGPTQYKNNDLVRTELRCPTASRYPSNSSNQSEKRRARFSERASKCAGGERLKGTKEGTLTSSRSVSGAPPGTMFFVREAEAISAGSKPLSKKNFVKEEIRCSLS
ncbi:hypothetical protein GQR58_018360 [Nymphon striatum]|nr:hypothetical protein GQR58_018360 [Nymphon striatum]